MKKQIISFTLVAAGFLLGATALSALASGGTWTAPSATPPNGNVSAPVLTDISTSPAPQQNRFGLLGLANLVVTNLNIASGTPGVGSVLVSDANGNASWAAGGASGGTSMFIFPDSFFLAQIGPSKAIPINTSFSSSNWVTENLGQGTWTTPSATPPNGGGLGIVPSGATGVILLPYLGVVAPGSTYYETLYARQTGSNGQQVIAQAGQEDGSGYSSYSGHTNLAFVPLSSNGSFDVQAIGNNYTSGTLTVVGYLTGSSLVPAQQPSAPTCSEDQMAIYVGTPVTISLSGNELGYKYSYDGTSWTSSMTAPSYTTSAYTAIGTYTPAVQYQQISGGGWTTVSCPQVTVTNPPLNASTLTCTTGAPTNSGTGANEIDKVIFTLKGTPTGGGGSYYYAFQINYPGDYNDILPTSSSPAGLSSAQTSSAPVNGASYTSPKSITVTYPDVSGASAGQVTNDLDISISSADSQFVTLANLCKGAPLTK